MQGDRGLDPLDDKHLQSAPHPSDSFVAVAPVDDQLGDKRVVIRRGDGGGIRPPNDNPPPPPPELERPGAPPPGGERGPGLRLYSAPHAVARKNPPALPLLPP